MPVRGLALPGADAFETPLGRVEIDASAVARIRHLPQVTESVAAHRLEHALEVHLPFLQRTLEDFRLVPLAVGHARREEVAEVLELLWGGDETLIVVSSDLSHYLPYEQARILDAETAAMIVDLRSDIVHERACGGTPINGLTLAAHRRGLQIELVDLGNSGDTAGSKDRVVGYAAFLVGAPSSAGAGATEFAGSHRNTGKELIRIARHAIEEKLGGSVCVPAMAAWLHRPAATFVTLTRQGVLRGCIGSLEPKRALASDVRENALGAAFRDPRFRPLDRSEWLDTRVEISLLSALEHLPLQDEGEVVRSLRPGIDGLMLEFGHHRGTFLPQVWEQLPEPAAFLLNLKRKAGLPPDFWEPGLRLSRYTVTKWREQDRAADDGS
jgi:AmmeMemoRadiSam system protein A